MYKLHTSAVYPTISHFFRGYRLPGRGTRRKFMGVEAGLTEEAQKRVHERRRVSLQESLGRDAGDLLMFICCRNQHVFFNNVTGLGLKCETYRCDLDGFIVDDC